MTTTRISLSAKALPTILSVTLSYVSADPLSPTDLLSLLLTLPDTFYLDELFDLTDVDTASEKEADKKAGKKSLAPMYELKGLIGYNGGHYVTWLRTTESDQGYDFSLSE